MTPATEHHVLDAIQFLGILLVILGVLAGVNRFSTRKLIDIPRSAQPLLSFGYIVFYGIVGGLLIFYGIKNFNGFFELFTDNTPLVDLISTSIVIAFAFLYAAQFKDIIANITGVKVSIDVYKNVIGYVLARVVLIAALFFASRK